MPKQWIKVSILEDLNSFQKTITNTKVLGKITAVIVITVTKTQPNFIIIKTTHYAIYKKAHIKHSYNLDGLYEF